MKFTLVESALIGILAGGWACSSYWHGMSGVAVGITAGLMAAFFLIGKRYGHD